MASITDPVFLGARVDTSVEALPEVFEEIEQKVAAIVEMYLDNGDEAEALRYLKDLKLQDQRGVLWTVGATTKRWMYRLPNERQWRPGHPNAQILV
jgi:hypothetical protein